MAACSCSSAWPTPATLPCPKMPKQPGMSRCRTPSRSLYWLARKRTSAWATVSRSGIDDLLEHRCHLVLSGHGVRAGEPRGHQRPGRVAEPHRALEPPAGQQAVAQRAAERVARAQSVDHVDRHGRDLDTLVTAFRHAPARAALEDRQLGARLSRGLPLVA